MTAPASSRTGTKALLLGLVLVAVTAFFAWDFDERLSLDALASERQRLERLRDDHPALSSASYVGAYVAVAALSLPFAAPLTLIGGAIFGLLWGTVLVSFASTIGATLAFLLSRFLARDWVERALGHRLTTINQGVTRDGGFYLLTLRLVPLVPFWAVNLAMGLTSIRASTFYVMSQLGMLPGTLIYVYAGTQLGRFQVGAGLVVALLLLAVSAGIGRSLARGLQLRRLYAPWRHLRPVAYDYNVVVVGGGSAGLVASYVAAATQAKVALVERHRLGGDCLYTGCVPSKALIRSANVASQIRRAADWGIAGATASPVLGDVMQRVARVVRDVEPHDSVARYTSLGVDVVRGSARLTSPWTVEVTGDDGATRSVSARSIVLATGARPTVPAIAGLAEVPYLTSDTVWALRELPSRLLVLGGGPIGCELAQAFARLGSTVTLVEAQDRLLTREDPDASAVVAEALMRDGVELRLAHTATRVSADAGVTALHARHAGSDVVLRFDQILVALGRTAVTTGLGLDALGIAPDVGRTIDTNEVLATKFPNIYACGDVAGPYQFTHVASHQASTAVVNALFGMFRASRVSYRAVPWATFTDPQVARVGLNESEARQRGAAFETFTYRLDDLDRAIVDGETHGFVKVLTRPGSDHMLGATVVGAHASETIAELVLAMTHGIGLNKVLGTIHIYPTFAESNRFVAGLWRRRRVTMGQQRLLAAFHAWRRGSGSLAGLATSLLGAVRDTRPAANPE